MHLNLCKSAIMPALLNLSHREKIGVWEKKKPPGIYAMGVEDPGELYKLWFVLEINQDLIYPLIKFGDFIWITSSKKDLISIFTNVL